MAEEAEFERVDYGDMDQGMSQSQHQVATNDLVVKPSCSTESCTCKVEEPAETAWIKLMSAVPQASQIANLRAGREGTMMLPEGHTIQSMVASIRPQPEADYALDTIRDEWIDFYEELRIIGPKLEQGLKDLSLGWKGDDFDAFEEESETVIKNCRNVLNDIGGEDGADGIINLLDVKQAEIFEQQGGTACVYPAPKFYMEGTKCGSHRIHIRPPFFRNCVIEENDEIKHAVELAGFDPTVVDEVHDGRQATYDNWLEYVTANPDYTQDGLSGEPLARKKADDWADMRLVAMGAKGSEQLEEQAALVNEEVTERHSNVEAQVTEIEPGSKPAEATTFNSGQEDLPGSGGLDIPDDKGIPDIPGGDTPNLDGMTGPDELTNLGSEGPDAPGGGGPNGGLNGGGLNGGGLNGGGPNGGDIPGNGDIAGLNEDSPFGPGSDPDNLGGTPPGEYDSPGLESVGASGGVNSGGLPPGDHSGGSTLSGLDSGRPWDSPETPDPEELSGGLAGGGPGGVNTPNLGGTGGPPSGIGGGPGLNGPGIGGGTVGGAGRPPSSIGGKGLGGTKGLGGSGAGGGRPPGSIGGGGLKGGGLGGGSGTAPGSGGRGAGGLGGGPGSGAGGGRGLGAGPASGGGPGSGAGGGRGLGAGPGSGAGGGRGAGGHGMMPVGGGAGSGAPGQDNPHERKVWLVEDDDVWGGAPEDEDEDPYA